MKVEKLDKIKNTRELGFQVSVSKTFGVNTNAMWEFLLSKKGIEIWVGEINVDDFEIQKQFVTKQGIEGKLTVFIPDCHLRLKWKPISFDKPATVELRVTNTNRKAKIIFHTTGFYKLEQQEIIRSYWKNIILKMAIELVN